VSVSLSVDGPGDAELISAVRGGDADAYGELFARHVDAARRLARQLAGPADADDLVSDAFTKVLTVLQRGGGPDLAFRAYLLTAVRRLHVDRIRAGSRLRPVDDLTPVDPGLPFQDTAVEGFDNAAAARAFASLPERWQMVLWHTEVEQQKPADIAPLLGMSANSVSALAYRAREGLRQAFLSQHATDPDDVDCAWTRDHLGAYVRGGLSRRDAARVDDHLASCRACAAVYLELTEVNSGLAGLLAPLLLGTAGAGYLSSSGAGSGLLSTTFTAAKTFVAAHTSVAAVGGMVVAATAVLSVYGATHLGGHGADTQGSPPALGRGPVASIGPSSGGDQNGQNGHHNRNGNHDRSQSPDRNPSLRPSDTPFSSPPTTPASTPPSTDGTDGPTDQTSGPTDPTSGPTDPNGGGDDITFLSDAPVNPKFGDTYQVRAKTSSGKTVTFSVDAAPSDACTLDPDTDTVTFEHAGTCVISADVPSKRAGQGDNTQRVDIPMEDQDIDFVAPDGARVDGSDRLSATSSSGLDVAFALGSDSDGCRLDGRTVSYVHALDCTVTASQDGNRDYHAASSVTRTFGIGTGTQTIDFTPPANPAVGGNDTLTATSSSGATVDFGQGTSGNGACTVTGSTVTYDHARDCTVTMSADSTDDYQALDGATGTFGIGKGTPQLSFVLPSSVQVKGSSTLGATSSPQGTISYSDLSDSQVCTLNQMHTEVRYHQVGTCTIRATLAASDDYLGATVDQTVTIVGNLAVDSTVDPNPTIGALFGYHHVSVDVTGLASDSTATLSASTGNGADVVAVGTRCGSLFNPARTCSVTSSPASFDWYVNLKGAPWTDVTFTATSDDGETASDKVRIFAWSWE
jgi:RNA polymerase sigma factor (sigma-70 family)